MYVVDSKTMNAPALKLLKSTYIWGSRFVCQGCGDATDLWCDPTPHSLPVPGNYIQDSRISAAIITAQAAPWPSDTCRVPIIDPARGAADLMQVMLDRSVRHSCFPSNSIRCLLDSPTVRSSGT